MLSEFTTEGRPIGYLLIVLSCEISLKLSLDHDYLILSIRDTVGYFTLKA